MPLRRRRPQRRKRRRPLQQLRSRPVRRGAAAAKAKVEAVAHQKLLATKAHSSWVKVRAATRVIGGVHLTHGRQEEGRAAGGAGGAG